MPQTGSKPIRTIVEEAHRDRAQTNGGAHNNGQEQGNVTVERPQYEGMQGPTHHLNRQANQKVTHGH